MGGALKVSALALLSTVLIAASEPDVSDYPNPPKAIADRIVDGRFEPGDFSHLKGAFADASAEEKAQYAEITEWLDRCKTEGKLRLEAEMADLGFTLEGEQVVGAANLCNQVLLAQYIEGIESYSDIEEGLPGARLVFNTLVSSVTNAERRAGPFLDDNPGAQIQAMTLGDQVLRQAFDWGWREQDDVRSPSMTDKERALFLALLNGEIMRIDHRNTQWLKQLVDEHGWPVISKVGKRGASAAWLLTQHADLDPAFQLRALRLMEPLVQEGEVSKRNYAYLYDRVMLKLSGKQRFATQVTCEAGDYVPRPLEEPERMDELRAEMNLNPFAEYRQNFPDAC